MNPIRSSASSSVRRSRSRRGFKGALIAVSALGAVAAALAGTSTASRNAGPDLTMWHWQAGNNYETVFKDAGARYTAKYDGNVNLSSLAFADIFTKFKTASAAGDVPDLIEMSWSGDYRDLIKAGTLTPLTSALKTGFPKFYAPVMSSLTYNGQIYGIPIDLNTLTIAYNKAIFKKLKLSVPKTYADLLALAAPIRKAGLQPLAVNVKDGWPNGDLWFAQVAYADPSGNLIRQAELGKVPWTSKPFVQAATQVRKLVTSKLLADGANSLDFMGNVAVFGRGQAAMTYPVGNFSTPLLDKAIGGKFQYDLFPFPAPKAGVKSLATGGPAIILSVPAKAKNKEAAINLIRLLTDATGNADLIKYDLIPSSQADISSNGSAIYKRMVSFQATAQTRAIFVPQVYTTLLNGMTALLNGTTTPERMTKGLQRAFKSVPK